MRAFSPVFEENSHARAHREWASLLFFKPTTAFQCWGFSAPDDRRCIGTDFIYLWSSTQYKQVSLCALDLCPAQIFELIRRKDHE